MTISTEPRADAASGTPVRRSGWPQLVADMLSPVVEQACRTAETAVLLGASVPELAGGMVRAALGPQSSCRRLVVAEPDSRLCGLAKAQAGGLASDPRLAVVAADFDDLRTDPSAVGSLLSKGAPADYEGYRRLARQVAEAGRRSPLVADGSAGLVVMDLVPNRLSRADGERSLGEAFRILSREGRLLLVVLVTDEPLPDSDVSAAGPPMATVRRLTTLPVETEAFAMLDRAGFHGMNLLWATGAPVNEDQGAHIRCFVVEAFRGKQGICLDQGHAVVYRGPWREVVDDDGHRYVRGERTAVCAKTYGVLMRAPYDDMLTGIPSTVPVPLDRAPLFDCATPRLREPGVSKGRIGLDGAGTASDMPEPARPASACAPGSGCCS